MSVVGHVMHGSADVLGRRARLGILMIGFLTAAAWLLLLLVVLVAWVCSPSMGASGDFELGSFLWKLATLLPVVAILVALMRLVIARRGGAELGAHSVVGLVLLSVPAIAIAAGLGSGPGSWSVAGIAGAIAVLALGILARRRGT